jgi:hypothetical protein
MREKRSCWQTQTVTFPKGDFTVAEAKKWLRAHHKKVNDVDITENELRFRQMSPSRCTKDYGMLERPYRKRGIRVIRCRVKKCGRQGR